MGPIGMGGRLRLFTLLVLAYYFLPKYLKMGAMTIPSADGGALRQGHQD